MLATIVLSLALVVGAFTFGGVKLKLFSAPTKADWAWKPHRLAAWEYLLATVVVLAMNYPLVRLLPHLLHRPPGLAGDMRTHAAIAGLIARWNLRGGWADSFMGGFPLGVHYPMLNWLTAAGITKLGATAGFATQLVAVASLLGGPWLALVLARRAGAGFLPGVAAAMAISYTAPYYGFVGGYESLLATGLYAQVTSIPYMVLLGYALATPGRRWKAPVCASLAVLAHPQVAFAAMLVAALPVLVAWSRDAFVRYVRAGLAVAAVGGAVYGPGITTLRVPFGWPRFEEWKIIGLPLSSVKEWMQQGTLVDWGRTPVVTIAWLAGFAFCALHLRRPAARAGAMLIAASLAGSMVGHAFKAMGRLGELLLSFLQPLRVMTVLPLCIAFAVAIAGHEVNTWLRAIFAELIGRKHTPKVIVVLGALLLGWASYGALETRVARTGEYSRAAREQCASRGFDANVVLSWVRGLRGGRLWFNDLGPLMGCADSSGFEAESAVPIGVTAAIGAHVGVHWLAARAIALGYPVSSQRAEALAVRYVLHLADDPPANDPGWRLRHRHGGMAISEREGGTDVFDVGCRSEIWRGSDKALRDALNNDLQGAVRTLSLGDWVELRTEPSRNELAVDAFSDPPNELCDATDARIEEDRTRTPGRFAATVTAEAPVDVVIRTANYPWWHVEVDGREVSWFTVAPGYLGVRVARGRHAVLAESRVPLKYPVGITLAFAFVALLSLEASAWARLRRRDARAGDASSKNDAPSPAAVEPNPATVAEPRNE